jgi:transcriptional regulator with XRE-family HTH domain
MNFSGQLKKRKTQLGKNLATLSQLTGMASSHISNIINGVKDAQASSLEAVADSLDASWVLVPKHLLPEVERLLSGKTIGPDDVPSTVDRLFGENANE